MPDRSHVRRALNAIKRASDYEFFFNELKSPDWIQPLIEERIFREPPPPERHGDYISFPLWPESRYLARMANLASKDVLEAIARIPDTENVRVHEDLVDAALAMPANDAARVVPRAKRWLESPYQLLLPDKLGKLVAHLAEGGEAAAAIDLARGLLAIVVQESPREGALRPEPTARFDVWHYEQILKKRYPKLLAADGEAAFDLLCDLLDRAIPKQDDDGTDHSYIWRPAIESVGQYSGHDVRNALVSAIRDASVSLVRSEQLSLEMVAEKLEARRQHVFQRLALHLLRVFAKERPDVAAVRIVDEARAENLGLHHEFWLLVRDAFPDISEADRVALLGHLQKRLDSDLAEAAQETSEEERADAERSARLWLLRRLAVFKDVLPEEWRERYGELVREFAEPSRPEFLYYSEAVWVGPTSPKSAEDLLSMELTALVEFLSHWEPSGKPMEESAEGLGRILSAAVAAEPERFASQAARFKGLDPTYIRGLISGLTEARKAKKQFAWEPTLGLCRWVVTQPREIPGRKSEYTDLDPGWGWTRKAVADLIAAGLEPAEGGIDFGLREMVWSILFPLTSDPEPTPEYEDRYGGDNLDPLTLSINTVRGEAMHTVVRYGLWLRRHRESSESVERAQHEGLDASPEVRDALEAHLDPGRDPSLAIRAVYGQWLPWLALLDQKWVRSRLGDIFPSSALLRSHRIAAWEAYILYSGPFDNVLELLTPEYDAAINRLGESAGSRLSPRSPDERLAEHLMIFYWRGRLSLSDPDGLIAHFYERAPVEVRAHALGFVGRALEREPGVEIPDAVLDRLVSLWDWRARVSKELSSGERATELAEFGWWFASGAFKQDWAMSRLLEVLRIGKRVQAEHLVVQRLAETVDAAPGQVLDALRLIVMAEGEDWGGSLWHEAAERILETGLSSKDVTLAEKSEEIINLFGAKGNSGFEHLLAKKQDS